MDSRLNFGNDKERDIIPEWFYQESKLTKGILPPYNLIITHIYLVWTRDGGFCRVWQSSPKVNREPRSFAWRGNLELLVLRTLPFGIRWDSMKNEIATVGL